MSTLNGLTCPWSTVRSESTGLVEALLGVEAVLVEAALVLGVAHLLLPFRTTVAETVGVRSNEGQ